uniref:Uncharacterized protein n=1 Tax=Alexandrium andersonii TaxID=327968 RepID=A0A7S2AX36_9DINO
MQPDQVAQGGGILGRFENVTTKRSAKRIIGCEAATAEYLRHDFLKPQHLPIERVDYEANLAPASNIHETRFHKGFQRRHRSDIQQDAARLEAEVAREAAREERARASMEATKAFRDRYTFNILTGEGSGRECEFRQIGKKIVNSEGSMEATFQEHHKDATNRIRNSKHRFFEHPAPEKEDRCANLFNEGLRDTVRESAVLGYGTSGVRRTRSQSCGVSDNYAHLRSLPREPDYEPPVYGNRSQIIFG